MANDHDTIIRLDERVEALEEWRTRQQTFLATIATSVIIALVLWLVTFIIQLLPLLQARPVTP